MSVIIGIDLGTTNSAAAVIQNDQPLVIPLREGKYTIPSVIGFSDDGTIVGEKAKRQSVNNPDTTVFSAKRLIGSSFDDPHTQRAMQGLPYQLVKGQSGDVRIKVGERTWAIQETSSIILAEIKRAAELHLGQEVERAVVTVPAYFNDRQRQATKEAGQIAGLEVLQVVNEPTAAALAYGYHQGAERRIAVYDLGGGTFDVTVLKAGGGAVEVLASAGDDFLGGHDFDDAIVGYLQDIIERKHGATVAGQPNSQQRLREAAEAAKIKLSDEEVAKIILPFLATHDGKTIHLEAELNRETFYNLVRELIDRTLTTFTDTITAAGLTPKDIDELLLVGGMTAAPVVRDAVRTIVDHEPASGVHPDLVVAVGAAYQASLLNNDEIASILLDVTPHNLGILTLADLADTVVPKNTKVPVQVDKQFHTVRDDQETVRIVVFQGDGRKIHDNQILGEFFLENLRPAPRGEVSVNVTFAISADGLVKVSATNAETGEAQSISVKGAGLEDGELESMIASAKERESAAT